MPALRDLQPDPSMAEQKQKIIQTTRDMTVSMNVLRQKAEEYAPWMVDIRRELHRHPEVSFQEHDTTRFVIKKLKELDIPVEQPLETGCVGILKGGKESDRVIALRADIDALSMQEEGEHKQEFLSQRPGCAHCCGHDAHTANLLGAARILSDLKEEIEGTIILIFQPGEETLPGGGRLLCETGFLQQAGVQKIVGLHTFPGLPPGVVATREGPMMARPDEFEVELIGRGGHAASPHLTVDPIVMAADVITRFQTVVSRSVDPTESAVLTVGKVQAGSTYNVIPGKANLIGTVRTFNRETAMRIRERMEEILKGVAEGAGGSYKFQFNEGYPAVQNDPDVTRDFRKTAEKLLGADSFIEMDRPVMAGEDFAFYQQHFPGTFFFLGSGSKEAESTWSWHHPRYNVDERCFQTGAPLMAAVALGL